MNQPVVKTLRDLQMTPAMAVEKAAEHENQLAAHDREIAQLQAQLDGLRSQRGKIRDEYLEPIRAALAHYYSKARP